MHIDITHKPYRNHFKFRVELIILRQSYDLCHVLVLLLYYLVINYLD